MSNEKQPTSGATRPEPLSIYVLHTPEAVRKWEADNAAYFAAIQAEEDAKRRKEEAERQYANRQLSADEAFAVALEQEQHKKAREAELEAEALAKRQRLEASLMEYPEVAEVCQATSATDPLPT